MRELIAEEFFYVLAPLLITTAAIIYYREKGVVHLNPYSTFWPRLLAPWIDMVILWPFVRLLPIFIVYFFDLPPASSSAILILSGAVIPLYFIISHGAYGATLGKFVTKTVLVDVKTKSRTNYKQALIRDSLPILLSIGWIIWAFGFQGTENPMVSPYANYMIPLLYGAWYVLELITFPFNPKKKAVQDLLAKTVVIRYDWN
jgi:uncharacterized RDD family membrane protein YckC